MSTSTTRRHPVRGFLYGIVLGLGLALIAIGQSWTALGTWPPFLLLLVGVVVGVIWSTVGPAKGPKVAPEVAASIAAEAAASAAAAVVTDPGTPTVADPDDTPTRDEPTAADDTANDDTGDDDTGEEDSPPG